MPTTQTARRAEPGNGNGQRKEWLLHTGHLCGVSVNHWRKLTQGDSTLVSEKAWLSVGSPYKPSSPCQGCWAGQPAFLPLSEHGMRPKTGHCGKVQSGVRLWGLRELRQALGHRGNQTSGSVTLTEKDSVSPKKHSAISTVPGSLSCAGFSVLRPVSSFAESGDTQHWFHSACHFPETRGTGQQAVKQLQPTFRSCTTFSQFFLLLLLVLLPLKLHTLAQESPPPGSLP